MSVRYLGFALLFWFPGLQQAQIAPEPCSAPILNGGYFVPDQESYPHDSKLLYSCGNGLKPAVEGWWATSTCENGKWSHDPQCINETSCLPPTTPNAVYDVNPEGWYEERDKIRIKCLEGYEHKDRHATAVCQNGAWPSLPVCERSIESCSEPPKMPHAVIINMKFQEVFAEGSHLLYECEDGFTTEGEEEKKIYCLYGNWTESRPCRPDYTCSFDTSPYDIFDRSQVIRLKEGESKEFPCRYPDYRSIIKCANRQATYTQCCHIQRPSDQC
ncbi:complement factor H-like [Mugil cephalus]|uniref:complement factor H-like n=1 Tax=Mugil cephalus TaxID=48193 RepID=UPI001FB6F21A|nr:complement factor H-like [Mugil cephalus]